MGRCVAGQTKTFGIELGSVANAGKFQVNPTLDAADFRISINGGAFAALTNTPTVTPSGGAQVQVILAADETTSAGAGGRIHLRASDSSGGEWQDLAIDFEVFATAEETGVTLADGAITAAKIAADAITDAKVASDVTIASVTGAVGSVTGNVGGNVAGSVASVTNGVTLANGAITAAVIATDAIDADAIAASAVSEIQSGLATLAGLFGYDMESGKTFAQAVLDIWATRVGDASSNSAATPTSITYDSPDGTVQVTHTHTTTSRTLA